MNFNMVIRLLSADEMPPYDLLLLADPSVKMIEKYLFESSVYVATIERNSTLNT
jgi:hypothetical protein